MPSSTARVSRSANVDWRSSAEVSFWDVGAAKLLAGVAWAPADARMPGSAGLSSSRVSPSLIVALSAASPNSRASVSALGSVRCCSSPSTAVVDALAREVSSPSAAAATDGAATSAPAATNPASAYLFLIRDMHTPLISSKMGRDVHRRL